MIPTYQHLLEDLFQQSQDWLKGYSQLAPEAQADHQATYAYMQRVQQVVGKQLRNMGAVPVQEQEATHPKAHQLYERWQQAMRAFFPA